MTFTRKFIIKMKAIISKIVLFFLYRGFKAGYKFDTKVKEEIDSWKDGQSFAIKTGIKDVNLCIKKQDGKLLKLKNIENPDIEITFKSIDAAFLMFTGRLGVAKAYAEHRFTLKGEINQTMSLVRVIDLVEAYLFPKFITKNILKEIPKKQSNLLRTYVYVLTNI